MCIVFVDQKVDCASTTWYQLESQCCASTNDVTMHKQSMNTMSHVDLLRVSYNNAFASIVPSTKKGMPYELCTGQRFTASHRMIRMNNGISCRSVFGVRARLASHQHVYARRERLYAAHVWLPLHRLEALTAYAHVYSRTITMSHRRCDRPCIVLYIVPDATDFQSPLQLILIPFEIRWCKSDLNFNRRCN